MIITEQEISKAWGIGWKKEEDRLKKRKELNSSSDKESIVTVALWKLKHWEIQVSSVVIKGLDLTTSRREIDSMPST